MSDIFTWPDAFKPRVFTFSPMPFSRSGGRSLGGIERTIKTDRGFWAARMQEIWIRTRTDKRRWNALRTSIGGRSGLVSVPAWSFDSAPFVYGVRETDPMDELFDDAGIEVQMAVAAAIGDTVVTLRRIVADGDLAGIRFSYEDASGAPHCYETGQEISVVGDLWEVPVLPAIRAPIPVDANLELLNPRCLMRLATDTEMDIDLTASNVSFPSVSFVEAVDFWNDLAAGLI